MNLTKNYFLNIDNMINFICPEECYCFEGKKV